jgi:hypothetical protein
MLEDWKDQLVLLRYGLLSYGIAALEWSMNPGNGLALAIFPSFKGTTALQGPWIAALCILPLLWILVVVIGIRKTGWWGLVLLLPIPLVMYWYAIWIFIFVSCAIGHDCL